MILIVKWSETFYLYSRKMVAVTVVINQSAMAVRKNRTSKQNHWFSIHLEELGMNIIQKTPRTFCLIQTVYKCVLWFILWGLFIELGFGAVYFILSISVILYMNMRSGSRASSEPSAYSVFNPNCERIDGTFTAEQFEKELRFGASSVHWKQIRQFHWVFFIKWPKIEWRPSLSVERLPLPFVEDILVHFWFWHFTSCNRNRLVDVLFVSITAIYYIVTLVIIYVVLENIYLCEQYVKLYF